MSDKKQIPTNLKREIELIFYKCGLSTRLKTQEGLYSLFTETIKLHLEAQAEEIKEKARTVINDESTSIIVSKTSIDKASKNYIENNLK